MSDNTIPKKYLYPTKEAFGIPYPSQDCKIIRKKTVKIGSDDCRKCDYCIGFHKKEGWIICRELEKALTEGVYYNFGEVFVVDFNSKKPIFIGNDLAKSEDVGRVLLIDTHKFAPEFQYDYNRHYAGLKIKLK